MKQYFLLLTLTFFGIFTSFWWTPYAGVALYYFYAVLRPQYLWKFQLDSMPVSLPWSFMVASAAIASYVLWMGGMMAYGRREGSLMRFRPRFTLSHWLMMGFGFWILVSYVFSNNRVQSENWFGEYLKIFAMYFLASRVVRTPGQLWGLFILLMVALSYIAWELNYIYVATGAMVLVRAGFAGLDNNGAGLMLAVGVPLCYFSWEMTRGWYRWVMLAMVPVIIHAVLCSYSRGAMVAMIAACPFYFFYSRKKKFLLFVFSIIMVLLPVMAGKEIQERFFSIQKRDADESWQSRQTSWRIAGEIAMDYPIVGAGIRCSNAEMKERGADMEGRTIHSLYMQIAADSGFPALATYICMILATFWSIWRARRRLWNRTDPDSRRAVCILGGCECGMITFLVGALALSLEVFEVAYLVVFIGGQVWAQLNASDTAAGNTPARRPAPMPPAARTVPPRQPAAGQRPNYGPRPQPRPATRQPV